MSFRRNIFNYLALLLVGSNGFVAHMQARERSCQQTCFKQTLCRIEEKVEGFGVCGTVTPISQKDIGDNGYVIASSGRYCVTEDLVFDSNLTTNAGVLGATAIAIDATNVDLDFNGHTMNVIGNQGDSNGVLVLGDSSNVLIHNGIIIGDGTQLLACIGVLTSNVTIRDMSCLNSGIEAGGIFAEGLAYASVTAQFATIDFLTGLVIERCYLENNPFGIAFYAGIGSAVIRDCTIDGSSMAGIAAPYFATAENVSIENCSISNSAAFGIYGQLVLNNWSISNCQFSNSGIDAILLQGMQNLSISNCQVYDSGLNGINLSLRANSNVQIADSQVFNSGAGALRVDNTENLTVTNCEFTNYIPTSVPVVKLQDIYNGTFSNCYVNSLANLADGLLLRNCHGLTVQDCGVNIVCTTTEGTAPVGINLLGTVDATVIRNCIVSGAPSIGINVGVDPLSLNNHTVTVENCTVQGAKNQGIGLTEAVSCAVYDSNASENGGDGIATTNCSQCVLRNNTVINNGGTGINDVGSVATQIYHNFANNNVTDYSGSVPRTIPYFKVDNTTGWYANVQS